MATAPGFESSNESGDLNEVAIVLLLDGQVDRARACWERELQRRHDPYEALQLCMLDLEKGKDAAGPGPGFEGLDAATTAVAA